MVLSNKKLKLKLRSLLAESLAVSQSGNASSDAANLDHQLQSVKDRILASKSQKPSLARRSKKRNSAPLAVLTETDADKGASGDLNDEESRKKKREGEGEEEEKAATSKSKKNKTKKWWREKVWKKKRKENADGNEGEKVLEPAGNEESEDHAKKVYVGGIPYYSTEDDIRSFFESCGTVTEVDCMKFPESGKFRGIAILTFKTEAAAKRAIALDGADMGGFYLKIQSFKANRTQKPDFAPEIVEGYNRVYVGNLSWDITEDDLRNLFSDCSITSLRWGMDKDTEEFKGYAHVDFSDSVSLSIALKLDQQIVSGRPVRIRCAVPSKSVKTDPSPKSTDDLDNTKTMKKKNKRWNNSNSASENADNGGIANNTAKKKRRTCYVCGIPGHLSSSCPQKNTNS
ncbi:nucleolin protein [Dioscorea alata]|uniref:Nucleolin protein n=1 Tax=Dioscorea alata TaxID=55571 RepID=A0ACB7V3J9_DIOAL|nr:nucleolin protein [Dioscorea alata]